VHRWLFHQLCFRHAAPPVYDDERFWSKFVDFDIRSAKRFFARLESFLEVNGKSVLDIGCGRGAVCVEAVRRGASRVVGVDLVVFPQTRQIVIDPELSGRVEFVTTDGTLRELGPETFDVVLSKDSFEHYANPELFISEISKFVKRGGVLAIGFGPLWKSPRGGHIEYMTPMPWAHLLFPENVIMAERERFRPDERARSFQEIRGGLNKITLARFKTIMASSGLACIYFETNVSDNPIVRGMNMFGRIPPLTEFLTTNVYGVWQKNVQHRPATGECDVQA
jgi:SAM-dependent methyltransferase